MIAFARFSYNTGVAKTIDYKQSPFFLVPSIKTRETRKWPRAWLKARDERGSFFFSGCRPRFSRLSPFARTCMSLTKSEKKRDCSQSTKTRSSDLNFSFTPYKGIRVPESGKFCLWNVESWVLESGIQLKESGIPLTIGIRYPSSSAKGSGIQYVKSRIHGVESRLQD